MKIFSILGEHESELEEVKKSLFFLKSTSMLSRVQKKLDGSSNTNKVESDLYHYLVGRRDELFQIQKSKAS